LAALPRNHASGRSRLSSWPFLQQEKARYYGLPQVSAWFRRIWGAFLLHQQRVSGEMPGDLRVDAFWLCPWSVYLLDSVTWFSRSAEIGERPESACIQDADKKSYPKLYGFHKLPALASSTATSHRINNGLVAWASGVDDGVRDQARWSTHTREIAR
jgi:hypothetical protein